MSFGRIENSSSTICKPDQTDQTTSFYAWILLTQLYAINDKCVYQRKISDAFVCNLHNIYPNVDYETSAINFVSISSGRRHVILLKCRLFNCFLDVEWGQWISINRSRLRRLVKSKERFNVNTKNPYKCFCSFNENSYIYKCK